MTFLLAVLLLCGAGLGLLDVLRLRTRQPLADAGLAWLVGCGWYAVASMVLRIGLGLRPGAALVLAVALLPLAGALLRRRLRPGAEAASPPLEATAPPAATRRLDRWLPRPRALWIPVALWVAAATAAVALHGINSPTATDDGVRVRAFTPMLAFEGDWPGDSKVLLVMAGALPTFVPAVAWEVTGRLDHFHVNYTVLAHLLAFLALALGLGVRSGRPQRGWATALAALSLPLLAYHLTSTYQDAVGALFAAATLLLLLEHARGGEPADASRAFLLALATALVKREGEIVGGTLAAVLLASLLWRRRREPVPVLGPALLALVPVAAYAATKAAAVGWASAFPLLAQAATGAVAEPPNPRLVPGDPRALAAGEFARALFLSGNAGMLFWALPLGAAARWRDALRPALAVPLAAALLVLAQVAFSSIWVFPQWTLDQSTVHRALLTPSALLAAWLAALLTEHPPPAREAGPVPGDHQPVPR